MNNEYFEYYGQYMTVPFIITIVGASLLLFAIITLVLAICLFGKKNRGLYAVNKTISIITLVTSILLTVVYAAIIGLVATSPELFVYQGGGIIGTIRDLTCGIFLAPEKFGVQIDTDNLNTRLPFIFYTLTVFVPAAVGFITVIVSCIAQRSSRKARNSASTPADNVPMNINQPVQNTVPAPAPIPAPVPVSEPVQTVQDNSPIDEAPIQKLVPETTAEAVPEVAEAPETTAEAAPEVAETPETVAETAPEVAETPETVAETVPEVAETPEATTETVPEVTEAPAEEKPIDEDKILNLVATPPAENTVSNDKPLFCMNCGTPLGGGVFCINCGTPAKPQSRTCKGCNAVLADDARFCMVCGTKAE